MSTQTISQYNNDQSKELSAICKLLEYEITSALQEAISKLYHSNPVWFINENPVVGYDVSADHVNLLFWSGQTFGEPTLTARGKFKAAGISYKSADEVDVAALQGWLEKSRIIQWDYKNIVKRHGELVRL